MNNKALYDMIFKRKSFHTVKSGEKISVAELAKIQSVFKTMQPLADGIHVDMKIVPKEETTCKRGEYCILLFSDKAAGYLPNIGYVGEQLDLWLASENIGVCWYGAGVENESARDA